MLKTKITNTSLFTVSLAILTTLILVNAPLAQAAPATRANPANSEKAADCNAKQTPTKIPDGPNKGKWYCKSNGQQPGLGQGGAITKPLGSAGDTCGGGANNKSVDVSINIGCRGKGNAIADMAFAVIRFLSAGVGLVIIASIIVGGIQYSGSRGDPQATAMAVNRIRSSVFALFIFIFAFAILNYLIPAGFLN